MLNRAIEIEGTWEEIAAHAASFAGRRLRLTVLLEEGEEAESKAIPSIEEKIKALMADIPDEEQAKLPADLADQHDHYIYGWSKK